MWSLLKDAGNSFHVMMYTFVVTGAERQATLRKLTPNSTPDGTPTKKPLEVDIGSPTTPQIIVNRSSESVRMSMTENAQNEISNKEVDENNGSSDDDELSASFMAVNMYRMQENFSPYKDTDPEDGDGTGKDVESEIAKVDAA